MAAKQRKRTRTDELHLGWAAVPSPILVRIFAKLSDAVDIVVAGEGLRVSRSHVCD